MYSSVIHSHRCQYSSTNNWYAIQAKRSNITLRILIETSIFINCDILKLICCNKHGNIECACILQSQLLLNCSQNYKKNSMDCNQSTIK